MSIFWGIVTAYVAVGVAVVVICNMITLKIARGDGNPFTLMRVNSEIMDECARNGLGGWKFAALIVISVLYNIVIWPKTAWQMSTNPDYLKNELNSLRGYPEEEDEP